LRAGAVGRAARRASAAAKRAPRQRFAGPLAGRAYRHRPLKGAIGVNRIDAAFGRLKKKRRKAFMPFIAAGDPSLDATEAILKELAARGAADLVELGVPYSDPIADGPTIQASYQRALAGGVRPGAILDLVARLRRDGLELPICLMVAYALVYRPGPEAFVERADAAGVDGLIVPDLPVEEAEDLGRLLAGVNLSQVLLVTPTTPPARRARILEHATGFVYCVSVVGITGERDALPSALEGYVKAVRREAKAPVCVGFGISRPAQVAAVAKVADGVIVGSAIVHRMSDHAAEPPAAVANAVADFCQQLAAPIR
jgi:tryptophan synthase alpha chain